MNYNNIIRKTKYQKLQLFDQTLFLSKFTTHPITPLKLGHLTLPAPLNQCCNQTSYAMQFARRVHSHNHSLVISNGSENGGYWLRNKQFYGHF